MTDDFTKVPISIGELRARKSKNGKDWTPRDALVETLRRIDCGEISPQFCIIVFASEPKPGDADLSYVQATPNPFVAQGLLSMAAMHMDRSGTCDHD